MRKKYSKITAKRMLATFVALLCLTAMMPMKAQTGNSVSRITTIENITTSENIISTSTVYLGEVIVGGETKIKYIYSADVSRSEAVIANLTECLKGMADADGSGSVTPDDIPAIVNIIMGK